MEYTTRNLESDPGMTQAEALVSLQQHPTFKQGSIISGIRKRGNQWIAEVLEPKTAEFPPPKNDGGDEEGASDTPPKPNDGPPSDPDNDGDDDSSPSGDTDKDFAGAPDGDKKPEGGDKPGGDKPEGKGSTEDAILHTLTQILHALTGGGAPEGVGGPDALGPGNGGTTPPPPKAGPPAPGGGAPGGPPPPGGGKGAPKFPLRALKPGDTPPGGTPVGAPAFSSVQANGPVQPAQGTPVPTGQQPVGQMTGGVCPLDGNPEPCPVHQGLNQQVASYSGKSATITLTTNGDNIKKAITDARPVVENYGYKVKQAKYGENGQIHILASRR